MHLKCTNVNDAFVHLVSGIHLGGYEVSRKTSRVGEVLQIDDPLLVTYRHPRERVLFNLGRDANCFFHLFESLWMLAGRNDVAPLAYYNSKIADIASDDGKTFNGAYGYRWRHSFKHFCDAYTDPFLGREVVDQLPIIIDHLRRKPESRRVVLQMWDVESDLLNIESSKDVCCNTCIYFALREEICYGESPHSDNSTKVSLLDMTVCNRSNDIVWGMLGANVVHFSFLQEYLANCLGVEVGLYHQFTNNSHVYTERFEPLKWLGKTRTMHDPKEPAYALNPEDQTVLGGVLACQIPLVKDQATFDREVKEFVDDWHGLPNRTGRDYKEPFLERVAKPMCQAFAHHKARQYTLALEAIERVQAEDWQAAGLIWIDRRRREREIKQAKEQPSDQRDPYTVRAAARAEQDRLR